MSILQQERSPLEFVPGETRRIPVKFIKGQVEDSPALIKNIAQHLKDFQRNILPIVVKVLGEDDYEAVQNLQILEAARQAEIDFAWCILINDQILPKVQLEMGELMTVDITKGTEQEIFDVLSFLKAKNPALNKIDPSKAAHGIVDHRMLHDITGLSFLTKLSCGLSAAKLPLVAKFLTYPDPPPSPPDPESIDITKATEQEICDVLNILKTKNTALKNIDPSLVAHGIIGYREGQAIASLSFLTKLKCGLTATRLPLVAKFLTYPEPPPSPPKPPTTTKTTKTKTSTTRRRS
ncbi:hypothetical protein [Neosynechococcus sphagnicola]|uniref:hypothetical protein n=1 Tax=Neosynechococcus sphagnicola TaxID=1501145 RepID=UPI00068E8761|nr:hypothetical protein [Neosynechococcus sphagnicola]